MWLAEQEKEKVNIPSKEMYQFPQDIQKGKDERFDVLIICTHVTCV